MNWTTVGSLAVWRLEPKSKPHGRILHVHGINEHSGRHHFLFEKLLSEGWEVVHFDLRGCGRSGGRRNWINTFQDYVDDVTQVYNWVQTSLPKLPLFLMGHSMGGGISIHFASVFHSELDGLILSAPAYKLGGAISPLTLMVGKFLEKFTPALPVPSKVTGAISRDPEIVKAYAEDKLCNHFNPLRQGNAVIRGLELVPEKCPDIRCPVLLFHGTHDRIILLEGSFEILELLGSDDRTLEILPGVYHEAHNDFGKEECFEKIILWLTSHNPGSEKNSRSRSRLGRRTGKNIEDPSHPET